MKYIFVSLWAILLSANASSQSQDSIKLLADAAKKAFTWDIQKSDKGTLMFLDVAYTLEGQDSTEYLTLTVAKNLADARPEFISVIIPNNIVQSNGIFIAFARTVKSPDGNTTMQMVKGNTYRIPFEGCHSETCTARIMNGYISDDKTNQQVDLFQKFLDFDHVLFLFIYADGSHKSVAIPLFSFKQQYKAL
ncbi:MAG: hypothetical protein M3N30_12580 [Bacteroidota bacterium]|nr:hypothetical protein [Bacteroidota bacterium]